MIKRVYFLKARQENKTGGTCHSFRTMEYKSWRAPALALVVDDFFAEISKANDLPHGGWVLESFSKFK